MGGTAWSDDHYKARTSHRLATNTPTFAYDSATRSRPLHERKAHTTLEPKGVKVRECRDSDLHPESRAVAVLFDVTGSMHEVPKILQANLPKLMGLLLRKNYLAHPQIMVGAIGDATCDKVPLQVGQFESGIEIEDNLTNLYLEGGGGGQQTESYELAMYFLARKAQMDCWEKRKQKGFCFIIGDEMAYSRVKKSEVEEVIGDTLEADIPLGAIIADLRLRFDVYYVLPKLTSYYDDPKVQEFWTKHLGQNFLRLEDPAAVCELIAATIGLESADLDAISGDLEAEGSSGTVGAVRNALATVAEGRGVAVAGLPDSGKSSGLASL
jgi:hypothetical protein